MIMINVAGHIYTKVTGSTCVSLEIIVWNLYNVYGS